MWFKNSQVKRTAAVFTAAVLSFSLINFNVNASDPGLNANEKIITIFHTNDMHGSLLDAYTSTNPPVLKAIGSDTAAALKKSTPNSLLVDCGDATQGQPFTAISKGSDAIKLMNTAGYDVMTLGNHEFDYGLDALITNAKLATFPIISANTIKDGKPLLNGINGNNGADIIKTVNDVKVGFFGITTQETIQKSSPGNLQGTTFDDPVSVSKTEVEKLKGEGAQVIVGIMHIGNDPSSYPQSTDIASKVNGINVILDGHSHTIENTVVNNTLIAQVGTANANIGKVTVKVEQSGDVSAAENLLAAKDISVAPDADTAQKAAEISKEQSPLFNTVCGRTYTSLWSGTVNNLNVSRLNETNLGDFIADAMKNSAKTMLIGTENSNVPVVSLENGGGVRSTIREGSVNMGEILSVLPFGNVLTLKQITPKMLYEVLENGVSKITFDQNTGIISGADGRFPQISGMRIEYDPSKTASNTSDPNATVGNRIIKVVLLNPDGTDANVLDRNDDSTKIILATNDFEAGGGDGYTMLSSIKTLQIGQALDSIVSSYTTSLTSNSGGSFKIPELQSRIKMLTEYAYQPYSVNITINNGTSPLTNTDIEYTIDLGKTVHAITDKSGNLTIQDIPSGAHTVSIFSSNMTADAYINNTIGSLNPTVELTEQDYQNSTDFIAAKTVETKIDAISDNISFSDIGKIKSASAAYDKLSKSQKSLVYNYSKLENAQNYINSYKPDVITVISKLFFLLFKIKY